MRPVRIHIGGPPRSGTTLMLTLIATCFKVDGAVRNETHLWRTVPKGEAIVCTKYPGDETLAPLVLGWDSKLWWLYLMRDPRDVVVSIHGGAPDQYWSNLRAWRESVEAARKVLSHPRFVVVRYEDLAKDPDDVQNKLVARMPFLEKTLPFSRYHEAANLDRFAEAAMRGLRPITGETVGAWREHKPRLAAQLAQHGDIADLLIAFGYERDREWLKELSGVEPEATQSRVPDRVPFGKALRRRLRRPLHAAEYLARRAFGG